MHEEHAALSTLIGELRKVLRPLSEVLSVRGAPDDQLDAVERVIEKLPSGKTIGETIDIFKTRATLSIRVQRARLGETADRALAEFVRLCERDGIRTREISSQRWRIESLCLALERNRGRASFQYGDHNVLPPITIRTKDDILALYNKAKKELAQFSIPDADLVGRFDEAFTFASSLLGREEVRPGLGIRIVDFQRALRLTLARTDLAKDAAARLKWPEFPTWAFVYNVDRYRAIRTPIPATRRVVFEFGAQSTAGIALGFLSPDEDPVKVSWVKRQN